MLVLPRPRPGARIYAVLDYYVQLRSFIHNSEYIVCDLRSEMAHADAGSSGCRIKRIDPHIVYRCTLYSSDCNFTDDNLYIYDHLSTTGRNHWSTTTARQPIIMNPNMETVKAGRTG